MNNALLGLLCLLHTILDLILDKQHPSKSQEKVNIRTFVLDCLSEFAYFEFAYLSLSTDIRVNS